MSVWAELATSKGALAKIAKNGERMFQAAGALWMPAGINFCREVNAWPPN
jgi:hypothetical protein